MKSVKMYKEIATAIDAWKRCKETNNPVWVDKWDTEIERLEDLLPSGNGFDFTKIDRDATTADKLVLTTSYHHMNDAGYYTGWTQHIITIRPSFFGDLSIKVSGRNKNDIKDSITETFANTLRMDVEVNAEQEVKLVYSVGGLN